jgi:hypothetical protein
MNIIVQMILKYLSYTEYLKLIKKCPCLINYYDYSKEGKYYNQNNIYRINDHLPYNLIYKENLYYYMRLMGPIYFYLDDFNILEIDNNFVILKSENTNYINFFIKLKNIIIQSFKKTYYHFDTGIIINNNNILIYILSNEFERLNLNYNSSKFLIKYIGVKLENYSKMTNNFQIIKSF